MTRVLITGATSGLGLELAKNFHAHGADLVLVGRKSLSELPELFNANNYCQADLASLEATVHVQDFMTEHHIHALDVVIHNAGIGYYGDVRDQSIDNIKALLEVNLHTPLAISHALLEPLKAAQGRLVFISSIAVDMPTPDYAVYSASKAALDGLARNLSVEFQGAFRVQVIHPGAIRTGMHHKSGLPKHVDTRHFADPEHVAQEIVNVIYEDRFDVTIGRSNRILRFLGRHFGVLLEAIMRWRKRRQAKRHPNQPNPDTAVTETPEPLIQAAMRVAYDTTGSKHEQALDVTPASTEQDEQDNEQDNNNQDNNNQDKRDSSANRDGNRTNQAEANRAEANRAEASRADESDDTQAEDTGASAENPTAKNTADAETAEVQNTQNHKKQNREEGVKEPS
jgi:short-subunit dehydrogenase